MKNEKVLDLFRAAGDETRLRILCLLSSGALSVNEILDVLQMGQSRVSRHLRILAMAGLLGSKREGSYVFYERKNAGEIIENFYKYLDQFVGSSREDEDRLFDVLSQRKTASNRYFSEFGPTQDGAQSAFVDSDYYRKEILSLLPVNPGRIADLGCGTGELSRLLALTANHLICIDQSPDMLEFAKRKIDHQSVEFRIGSIEHLPMREAETDMVVLSMALHHIADPVHALKEAARVLKKKGRLILADLKKHKEAVMQERFADLYLGFEPSQLRTFIEESGFQIVKEIKGKGKGKLECLFFLAEKRAS